MKPGETLFDFQLAGEARVQLVTVPYDGPRGNRVQLMIGDTPAQLPEGPARQLHLALRKWVRVQKKLRGDTPRGRAELAAKEAAHAPAAR